jgi:two-component system alkaline phosphatase synthesis response regulator PhoP
MNRGVQKILIVDDEPDIREFLSYNLMRAGYHVLTATDGWEGCKKAEESLPDLIILDVLMPVLDGHETCKRLRQDSRFDNTKIVYLSALNESTARDFGLALEADAFIGKPIKIDLLLKRIETWLKSPAPITT